VPGGAGLEVVSVTAQSAQGSNARVLAQVVNGTWRNDDGDHWIQRASAILPVKAGTWYTKALGSSAATGAFIETGLGFGDWSPAQPGFMPPADGFVACLVQMGGSHAARLDLYARYNSCTVSCGAHGGEIATAGICVPAWKDATVWTRWVPTDSAFDESACSVQLFYMPLTGGGWVFGAPEPMSVGTNYTATDSDGFAIASLMPQFSGDRGFLEIRTFDGQGQVEPLYAACGVHWNLPTDRQIQGATCMLPISRGKAWRVDVTSTTGQVAGKVWWVPVTPG
jgi:hypothetical protein